MGMIINKQTTSNNMEIHIQTSVFDHGKNVRVIPSPTWVHYTSHLKVILFSSIIFRVSPVNFN